MSYPAVAYIATRLLRRLYWPWYIIKISLSVVTMYALIFDIHGPITCGD